MSMEEANNSIERPTQRRRYVAPSLSRYGTLADVTRAQGDKHLNDGQGGGCGLGNNFFLSCVNPS
jgi:hypothetical protein